MRIVDSVHDTDGDDAGQRSKSSKHTVVLFDLKLEASGTYRCEVSAEAPSFRTKHEEVGASCQLPKSPNIKREKAKFSIKSNGKCIRPVQSSPVQYSTVQISWERVSSVYSGDTTQRAGSTTTNETQ